MKIAIITAITGGMDDFKAFPLQIVRNDDHKCVFLRQDDSNVPPELKHLNKRTQALYFKQQMHKYMPGFDVYIWLDGKIQVLCADFVQQCLDALGTGELAILKHGERSCVYEEVNHILHQIRHGNKYLAVRYGDRALGAQLRTMVKDGYPMNNGLNDCSIICVRGTEAMAELFSEWWKKCQDEKAFDQIWIKFLAWFFEQKINDIEFKPASFKLVKHNKVQ